MICLEKRLNCHKGGVYGSVQSELYTADPLLPVPLEISEYFTSKAGFNNSIIKN